MIRKKRNGGHSKINKILFANKKKKKIFFRNGSITKSFFIMTIRRTHINRNLLEFVLSELYFTHSKKKRFILNNPIHHSTQRRIEKNGFTLSGNVNKRKWLLQEQEE